MNVELKKKSNRSRVVLILLILLFAAPIAIPWLALKNETLYELLHPKSTKSFGDLISPARPLADIHFIQLDGTDYPIDNMHQKWSYLYISDRGCDQDCIDSLTKVRDARYAQSGDALRVNYYLILTNYNQQNDLANLIKEHPRMTVLTLDNKVAAQFLDQFRIDGESSVLEAGRVYLVDPIGNLMMSYPQGFHRDGLLKDLKKILHYSQIG